MVEIEVTGVFFFWVRKVGKRKAVSKVDQSSKRKAKKEKRAKKDPNKPKRPPSAFFVFLYVSFTS